MKKIGLGLDKMLLQYYYMKLRDLTKWPLNAVPPNKSSTACIYFTYALAFLETIVTK